MGKSPAKPGEGGDRYPKLRVPSGPSGHRPMNGEEKPLRPLGPPPRERGGDLARISSPLMGKYPAKPGDGDEGRAHQPPAGPALRPIAAIKSSTWLSSVSRAPGQNRSNW